MTETAIPPTLTTSAFASASMHPFRRQIVMTIIAQHKIATTPLLVVVLIHPFRRRIAMILTAIQLIVLILLLAVV